MFIEKAAEKRVFFEEGHHKMNLSGLFISYTKKFEKHAPEDGWTVPDTLKDIPLIEYFQLDDESKDPGLDTWKLSEKKRKDQSTTTSVNVKSMTSDFESKSQPGDAKKEQNNDEEIEVSSVDHKDSQMSTPSDIQIDIMMAVEKAVKTTLDKYVVNAVEKAFDMKLENALEKALEKAEVKMLERPAEKALVKFLEENLEMAAEKALEKVSEKDLSKAVKKSVDKVAERAVERALTGYEKIHTPFANDQHVLERKPSKKKKAPPLIPGLKWNRVAAPGHVSSIQSQLEDRLRQKLPDQRLQDDPSGPTIAFVVNSSRVLSDAHRDLNGVVAKTGGIVLVIRSTGKPDEKPERLSVDSLNFPWVEEAVFLMVNINNTHLHDCDTNSESTEKLINYLKRKMK